jgi:hypothetical protein
MMRHLNFDTATIDGYEHYVGIKFKTNAYTDEMRSVDDDTRTEDDIEDSDENDWDI